MIKNDILLKKIKEAVKMTAPDATIILYGSFARGEQEADSDIDLLILLNKDQVSRQDEKEIKYPLYDLEFETGQIISPIVLSKSRWEDKHRITPFYENVMREGVVLWNPQKGMKFSDIFDKRQTGDYDDFIDYTKEEVLDLVEPAKKLIDEIEGILDGK